MKVVINIVNGGFSLSQRAKDRYAAIKGIAIDASSFVARMDIASNIARNDPTLIQIVEELGEAASGEHSLLKIEEVPDGVRFFIDEYDGMESVVREDQIEWVNPWSEDRA